MKPSRTVNVTSSAEELPKDPRSAVDRLCALYFGRVCASLARRGVPKERLAEAAQDVFLTAYLRLVDGVELYGDPWLWVWVIARKTAKNVRTSEESRPEHVSMEERVDLGDGASAPEAIVSRRELLYRLFREVDEGALSVFVAIELEEIGWEEVARAHEISVSAAKKRHKVALEAMQAALGRWKAQEERRGAVVMPIALGNLLDADRGPLPLAESLRRSFQASLDRKLDEHEMGAPATSGPGSTRSPRSGPSVESIPPVRSAWLGSKQFFTFLVGAVVGGIIVYLLMRDRPQIAPAPLPNAPAPVLVMYSVEVPSSAAPPLDAVAPGGSAFLSASGSVGRGDGAMGSGRSKGVLIGEAMLLDAASSALAKGSAGEALGVLLRHRRLFPDGQYVRERNALLARVCALPSVAADPACAGRVAEKR